MALSTALHSECKLEVATYIIVHIIPKNIDARIHKRTECPTIGIRLFKQAFDFASMLHEPIPEPTYPLTERTVYATLGDKPFGVLVVRLYLKSPLKVFARFFIFVEEEVRISHSEIPIGIITPVLLGGLKQRKSLLVFPVIIVRPGKLSLKLVGKFFFGQGKQHIYYTHMLVVAGKTLHYFEYILFRRRKSLSKSLSICHSLIDRFTVSRRQCE